MRSYKTKAIVLAKKDTGEADRIYRVYSYEYGLLIFKAKGSRRIKSKLSPHLELFSESLLFIAKGNQMDVVTGTQTLISRAPIKKSLSKVAAASTVAAIILDFIKDRNELLYKEANETLDAIAHDPENEFKTATAFGWRALSVSGFAPELKNCVVCERELAEDSYCFSGQGGGLLCKLEPKEGRLLSPSEIKTLRFLCQNNPKEVSRLKNAEIGDKLHRLLFEFMEWQIRDVPKSLQTAYNLLKV